jgi:hypothetical protein
MKPVLAAIQVKKVSAETSNVHPVNTKLQATVAQTGNASFGVGPDGTNLVHSSMTLDASVLTETTKETLLKVHTELEAVFVELEPAIGDKSTTEELTAVGNFYAAQLYPHAISHMNRIFNEMGFGVVQLNVKYPGSI